MKTLKIIKIITLILFVTMIISASFFGVYKKEDFRTVNIIKGYKLGMQFTNSVEFTGTVKPDSTVILDNEGKIVENDGETEYTEENGYTIKTVEVNKKDDLNLENYKLTKKILKNRLKGLNVGEYRLKLNNETGEITIRLQDNEDAHEIEEHLLQKGNFTIIDKNTEEVLLDKSQVKSAKVMYGPSNQDQSTTVVYLQINFNKEGTKKLEEISQVYVENKTTKENEKGEKEEVDNTKYVSVILDGETLSSTYFGEKMSTGVLYIPITQSSDNETLTEYIKEVNNYVTVINTGVLPIEYNFEEKTLEPEINKDNIIILIASFASVFIVELIGITIKFKTKGFLAGFMQIGYIALLLLTVRYTNVIITVQTIVGIGISAILNLVFNIIILNSLKNKEKISWKTVGKFALWTIPLYIIAVILSFNNLTVVNSLGMTLVWGSICLYLYNLTLTKAVIEMLNR